MDAVTFTTVRPVARRPEQMPELFAGFAGAGDVDAMTSLLEPGTLLRPPDGVDVRGAAQLRDACGRLAERGVLIAARADAAHVCGDLALVGAVWTAGMPGGAAVCGRSTAVLRRQPDGRWLTVIVDAHWGGCSQAWTSRSPAAPRSSVR